MLDNQIFLIKIKHGSDVTQGLVLYNLHVIFKVKLIICD